MRETDSNTRNKRVGDVSWSEFRRMLTYKCEWYGKNIIGNRQIFFHQVRFVIVVGIEIVRNQKDIRIWSCPACNSELDRDVNAAINILNEGLRLVNN